MAALMLSSVDLSRQQGVCDLTVLRLTCLQNLPNHSPTSTVASTQVINPHLQQFTASGFQSASFEWHGCKNETEEQDVLAASHHL